MSDSVQYVRVGIECMIEYSMEEQRYNVRQCTVWKSRDRMYDSVQYGKVEIECKIVYRMEEW